MTLPDFGPERPGDPSETRQMVERGRTQSGGDISGRSTLIAMALIVIAIVAAVILLR